MFKNKYFKFYRSLPKNIKKGLIFSLILFFFAPIFELLTIISIESLVSALFEISNTKKISDSIGVNFLFFSYQFKLNYLIFTSVLLSTSAIITRYISLKKSGKYTQMTGAYLANRVLTSILINTDDDSNLKNQGSDSVTSYTSIQIDYAVSSIMAQFQFINNLLSTLILSIGIIYITPVISISLIFLILIFYVVSALVIRPIMKKNGLLISDLSLFLNKESLNLYQIRDQLRIQKDFSYDTLNFNLNIYKKRMGLFINQLISNLPRMLIDYFIFLSIPFLVFFSAYLSKFDVNLAVFVPSLITLGVAMQRLLPNLNLLFRLWSRIKGFNPSLFKLLNIINSCSDIKYYKYSFNKKNLILNKKKFINNIQIRNLSYITKQNKSLLKDCDYEINKGDSICIMGESGSGKTTFLRLISGLLKASSGQILINGRNISEYYSFNHTSKFNLDISYIPQSVNLFSGTILENLTLFSDKEVDIDKVNKILKMTFCYEFIRKLPNGINEVINDRSFIKLSGGQIQRLVIARALYQNPSMIVMDESTNALDKVKEENLIKNLVEFYNGILIMISHRKNVSHLFKRNIIIRNQKLYEV